MSISDVKKSVGSIPGSVNRDGSVTAKKEHKGGNASSTKQVTESKSGGWLAPKKSKAEVTSKTEHREVKKSWSESTDAFGRSETSDSRTTKKTTGNATLSTTVGHSSTTGAGTFDVNKTTAGISNSVVDGKKTNTSGVTVTTDDRGNRQVVREESTKLKQSDTVSITSSSKETSGSSFNVKNESGLKDGKFNISSQGDWKSGSATDKSWAREDEKKKTDGGFSQVKDDKLGKAQKAGDLLAAMGLQTDLVKKEDTDTLHSMKFGKDELNGTRSFVGADAGVRKQTELTVGANGLKGNFKREAVAGVYAQTAGKTTGKHGTAEGALEAKAEATASVNAKGTLNSNGLDASAGAKVSVGVEASASGKLKSNEVTIGGEKFSAGVDGKVRVSAEAKAEATVSAKVTRNPPTVVLEGKAGVSAVAKAEAEGSITLGPIKLMGSAYGSAGVEAQASGVIGYQDGKLKISGSLGAAVGLGAGAKAGVEIDVAAIGKVAVNTAKTVADVNGDGKLGLDDVSAAASKAANVASNAASAVGSTVSGAASKVAGWFGW